MLSRGTAFGRAGNTWRSRGDCGPQRAKLYEHPGDLEEAEKTLREFAVMEKGSGGA